MCVRVHLFYIGSRSQKEVGRPSTGFSLFVSASANASNYLTSSRGPLAEAARWVCAVLAAAVWRVNPTASSVYLAGSEMCKYIICKAGKERLGRICGSVGRTKKNVF